MTLEGSLRVETRRVCRMDDVGARSSTRETVQRPGSSSEHRVGEEVEGQRHPFISAH